MRMYRNSSKNEMSALKLALIITGSIVAASAILLVVLKFLRKKYGSHCECCPEVDDLLDLWESDDDDCHVEIEDGSCNESCEGSCGCGCEKPEDEEKE